MNNEIASELREIIRRLKNLQENEDVYENEIANDGVDKCILVLNRVKAEFGGEDDSLFDAEDDEDEDDDYEFEEEDEGESLF